MTEPFTELRDLVEPPDDPVFGSMSWAESEAQLGGRYPEDLRLIAETYGSGTFAPELYWHDPRAARFFRYSDMRPVLLNPNTEPHLPWIEPIDVSPYAVLVQVAGCGDGSAAHLELIDGVLRDERIWLHSTRFAEWIVCDGPVSRLLVSLMRDEEPEAVHVVGSMLHLNPLFLPSGYDGGPRARLQAAAGAVPSGAVSFDVLRRRIPIARESVFGERSWDEVRSDPFLNLEYSPVLRELFEHFGSGDVGNLSWWDPRDDRFVDHVVAPLLTVGLDEFAGFDAVLDARVRLVPIMVARRSHRGGPQILYGAARDGHVDDESLWIADTTASEITRVEGGIEDLLWRSVADPHLFVYRDFQPRWPKIPEL